MSGEKRRAKSLRIGVHNANAVVWGPVYRTHLRLDGRTAGGRDLTDATDRSIDATRRDATRRDETRAAGWSSARETCARCEGEATRGGRRARRDLRTRRERRSTIAKYCAAQARSIIQFFTHRPVSTFDRFPFQLMTGELFLYGIALISISRRSAGARSVRLPMASSGEGVGRVDLDRVVCLDDLERAAGRVMDRQDFDYFAGGAPRPASIERPRCDECPHPHVERANRLIILYHLPLLASFPRASVPRRGDGVDAARERVGVRGRDAVAARPRGRPRRGHVDVRARHRPGKKTPHAASRRAGGDAKHGAPGRRARGGSRVRVSRRAVLRRAAGDDERGEDRARVRGRRNRRRRRSADVVPAVREVRSIHWFPYDRDRVVNADP